MGETQRSPTISTQSRKIAQQTEPNRVCEEKPPVLVRENSFARIRQSADRQPESVFTALAHHIGESLSEESFRQVRKSEAAGVDQVTAKSYAGNPDANLCNPYQRLKRGQYVATPAKRIWTDKEDGKKRPIGIPASEDKIVQKAVVTILEQVSETKFYDFSHGFRKGHSRHQALHGLRQQCAKNDISRIADADVKGYSDNTDHHLPEECVRQRVNDGKMTDLIGKWPDAGVTVEGKPNFPETGTPQGGVISPISANIFPHYVSDDRFVQTARPRSEGRSFVIRWADDFIIGCEAESDAQRIMKALAERFGKSELSPNTEKTKLVPSVKPGKSGGHIPETSDYLGFTFYRGKSPRGYRVIKKKTAGKRLKRFIRAVWRWCKENRHEAITEQYEKLCQKLRGYYQYFGVISNYEALAAVFEKALKSWQFWLSRRSHKGKITWEKFEELKERFPLPRPRIIHNI